MSSVLISVSRIVVVMPNWLGDGVMATPFLRTLRGLYPEAHIAAVARPLVAPVLAGLGSVTTETRRHGERGWVDEVKVYEKGAEAGTAKWMRAERFELGILLPNSFRSAWMMWRGKVKRRLGYARGGRSLLLTDRISAQRRDLESYRREHARAILRKIGNADIGGFLLESVEPIPGRRMLFNYHLVRREESITDRSEKHALPLFVPFLRGFRPVPMVQYYLDLAQYLRSDSLSPTRVKLNAHDELKMKLATVPVEHEEAECHLNAVEIEASDPLVVIVPGANFGASKCWLPERFAEVADRLADRTGPFAAKVILAGSPSELPIVETIFAACKQKDRIFATAKMNSGKGVSIGALKEIVRRSALMVCNDTGPRHFAAAFGVPLVTLFGPTDPVWAQTYTANERIVRIDVPCGPCQLKKCPIDHRCMRGITVEMVMRQISDLWPRPAAATQPPANSAAEAGG